MDMDVVNNLQINRLELSEVYCPDDPQVDIVLVHGLNGHPRNTWTAKNGVFWPAQLLPKSLGTVKARILVYGYNADVYAFGGKSATSDYVHQHAQTLVTTLDAERFNEDATQRPIIFVAHSLGGILVKRALEYSANITSDNTQDLRSIFVSTYGIIFLGTPHNGADPAKWGKVLESMCGALLPRKLLDTEPQLVRTLQTQSETLQNINIGFVNIMDKFHLCFFHEAVKTNFGITQDFVVDQNSASPILPGATYAGIEASHSDMCKFESKNAPGYTAVSANLKRFAQAAPAKIRANWNQEMSRQEQVRQFQAFQLLGATGYAEVHPAAPFPTLSPPAGPGRIFSSPDISNQSLVLSESSHRVESESSRLIESQGPAPDPAGPPLIVPAGFRPNSIFVGMQKELEELDEKLFDADSRGRGSACVLLWAIPGGGKSHLARQYLYRNIDKFPGGVFWVRAKSKAEIAQDFWVIAQKMALKDVKDPELNSFEEDTEVFIKTVKAWFEQREGWLLIFDGISIDKDAEKTSFQAFIPDSKNSAVILTSTDKSLAGSHRLLSPVPVKVLPLSEEDARTLLFAELNIRVPSQPELDKATELARKVGRLPLAIHVIGHRLRATGEPLAKYHIRPFSDPKLREPFKEIMEDLDRFRHHEARNLINILSFFGQHIPVEMIHLGVNVLQPRGIEVRARVNDSRPDLNMTLGILIRYALIERNDPDDAASQGSHPSLAETIDMLRIHSLVQSFIYDTLKSKRQLAVWLGYAVSVFCRSFQEAHTLIQREGPGLVRDYREYEVHGKRLMDHVARNRPKSEELGHVQTLLEGSLQMIEDEILRWTPSSSQEAAGRHARHLSIFDRTSSTPDTSPETPEHGPSNLTVWGWENDKPRRDSPLVYPVGSHQTQIVSQVHIPPYAFDDTGYASDLDPDQPVVMPQSPRQTLRPDLSEEHIGNLMEVDRDSKQEPMKAEDFQAHRAVSAIKERRYREKVSAWRFIPPTIATPSVSEAQANEAEIRSPASPAETSGEYLRGASAAEVALVAVQRRSPPAPRGRGRLTDRRQESRTRNSDRSSDRLRPQSPLGRVTGQQPDAASDSAPAIVTSSPPIGIGLPHSAAMLRADSGDSLHSRQSKRSTYTLAGSNMLPVSTVQQAAVVSTPTYTASLPAKQNYMTSRSSSPTPRYVHFAQSSNPDLRSFSSPYATSDGNPIYRQTKTEDRYSNPAISQRTPASPNPGGTISPVESIASLPRPASPLKNFVPASDYSVTSYQPAGLNLTVTADPVGYSSEPMSRDTSDQSAIEVLSLIETEPGRLPPPLSPHNGTPRLAAVDRLASQVALPVSPISRGNFSVKEATPRYTMDGDFAAMGGWTLVEQSPTVLTTPAVNAAGPGIATGSSFVRFGDHDALNVGLAKRQLEKEHERNRVKMQEAFDSGAFRPTPPYPLVNPMPRTGSDIRRMMLLEEQERRGKKRGVTFSSPPRALQGGVTIQAPLSARTLTVTPAPNIDATVTK